MSRILIVDDEDPIREFCVRTLAPLGHTVETAKGAQDALACFDRQPFDLLITDYRMPGALDGLGLGQEIKQRFPQTQLILMTGFPTLENALAALQVGAADYLVKPFEQAELVEYVSRRHTTLGELEALPKILLIDDSRTILAIFKGLFEKAGYVVLTAKDGEAGLANALEHKPNLIILDGELPLLNGFEVCRLLRLNAQMKTTKILMFTGGTDDAERQRAQEAGADGFLSKGANPGEILMSVRRLFPAINTKP